MSTRITKFIFEKYVEMYTVFYFFTDHDLHIGYEDAAPADFFSRKNCKKKQIKE